jgi:L-seryl-tRNA(Ser) seleniumtransferase
MHRTPDDANRRLPSVDALLRDAASMELIEEFGRPFVVGWTREAVAELRASEAAHDDPRGEALRLVAAAAEKHRRSLLREVINATGVILHTNLGRAPLADEAIKAVAEAARNTNVEIDLHDGSRSRRGMQIEELFRVLTGAEACLVVNNCAAATVLTLQAIAAGKEVVVSRGQLIEIGGSYRLPDVFRVSGAILKEVGTTNRTRLADYETAVGANTAALLRVHPSNFRVVGFTESAGIAELADLAHRQGLLAIDDVGSGSLVDLKPFGFPDEPTVADSLKAGADLVLFSGDKLLGGPQCGVILGKKSVVERLHKSPLARALRVDKLTLAALQATLQIYARGKAFEDVPVLRMLTRSAESVKSDAEELAQRLPSSIIAGVEAADSQVGGGSLPTHSLPTFVVSLKHPSTGANELARRLRTGTPSIVARVERDAVLFDLRTVLADQRDQLVSAITMAIGERGASAP